MTRQAIIVPEGCGLNIGQTQDIVVAVTWEAGDQPVTADDRYVFDLDASVEGTGSLLVTDPRRGTLPITVAFVPDPGGRRMATASITVQGNRPGMTGIKGSDYNSPGELPTRCRVNVFPSRVVPRYKDAENFSRPAMPVTDQSYEPGTAPDALKSTLVIEAVDEANPEVGAGPYCPITLYFINVRETPENISGKFYANGVSFVPRKGTSGISDAKFTAYTDDNSQVVLTVLANSKDGYISCYADAGNRSTPTAFIYLLDDRKPADGQLTRPDYHGPSDITGYSLPTVPVFIRDSAISPFEEVGLFLNGKFESQTGGNRFGSGNPVEIDARTDDLIVTDNPGDIAQNNRLFYCVSNVGDLRYSTTQVFPVTGTPPGPTPDNPILSKMIEPRGLVINMASLDQGVNAVMDVRSDVGILRDRMKLTLSTAQKLRVVVVAQGRYDKTGQFAKNTNHIDTALTPAMLASSSVSVAIPRDFLLGYDYPPDAAYAPIYTIWYGYVNASSDRNTFASSPIVTGPLRT